MAWTPIVSVLVAGCLGQDVDGSSATDETAASGGATTNASGGVMSGGTTSETSGGSASGGTGEGFGGTTPGSGGLMTEEEWQAAIAPRSGPHEIWTRDVCEVPHTGSVSVRVGQEYSIIPALGYDMGPDFDTTTNVVFDVKMYSYCVSSAECTDEPGGVCQGQVEDAYCEYPDAPAGEPCSNDLDCTRKPNGSCLPAIGFEEYRLCYPTGVCEDKHGECSYAIDPPCTGNADCTEHPGGTCIFPIRYVGCNYDHCTSDADCAEGTRCGCGQCEEANCTSDETCPEGETCEFSPGLCFNAARFECTTPADECTAGEAGCFFNEGLEGSQWGEGICLTK